MARKKPKLVRCVMCKVEVDIANQPHWFAPQPKTIQCALCALKMLLTMYMMVNKQNSGEGSSSKDSGEKQQ